MTAARIGATLLLVLAVVASVGWVLWRVDLAAAAEALAAAGPLALGAALVASAASIVLRTFRLQAMLPTRLGWADAFVVMCIGSLATSFVPLRMGELARPYVLADRHGVTLGESLGTIVVERFLDVCALLALLALTGWAAEGVAVVDVGGMDLLAAGLALSRVVAVGGLTVLVLLVVLGERGVAVVERTLGLVSTGLAERVAGQVRGLVEVARTLARSPLRLAIAVLTTAATWAAAVGMTWCVVQAFPGLPAGLDLVLLFWSACITSMTLLPSPGFVGTFDAAGLAALLVLGVASGPAGAAAVTLHVVMLLPVVVLGLGATLKVGVGLRSLVRER
ncbi:MAG: flippase-like domain-containing protein [Alphaproteobacteria bacterium]|nr:flippase-like domain-containing protein [Alphaproteobacteria bacterium]